MSFYGVRRERAHTFLDYQRSQAGGLPNSRHELERCYSLFCTLHPSPPWISFGDLFYVMTKLRMVFPSYGDPDSITYSRGVMVIVDPNVSVRNHEVYCETCKIRCARSQYEAHMSGRRHRAALLARFFISQREANENDRDGIQISRPNLTMRIGLGQAVAFDIFKLLANVGEEWSHTLTACELVQRSECIEISDPEKIGTGSGSYTIRPRSSYHLTITCSGDNFGFIRDILIFRFAAGFNIYRYINIEVSTADADTLAPTAPYRRPSAVRVIPDESKIIPGEPIPRSGISDYRRLSQYFVPIRLREELNRGVAQNLDPLNEQNYVHNLKKLLWIEEVQMDVDIRRYDRSSKMTVAGQAIVLKVPGLAENRPSVMYGDAVYVTFEDYEYQGIVHKVEEEVVHLKFDRRFHNRFDVNRAYQIRFSFKRTPLRGMHAAIEGSVSK